MSTDMTWWPQQGLLARFADAVYVLRGDERYSAHLAGALLPQLQWRLEGGFAWQCGDRPPQPLHRASALGPSTAAIRFETHGPVTLVGIGLFPEGWAALMPQAAGSVVEQVLDLEALWGGDAAVPLAADPREPDAAIAARVAELLAARLAAAPAIDPRIAAISAWANGRDHDIDALARALGVSHRHLDRLARAAHGLPPRLLANKHKILRMAAVLAIGQHDNRRETWTEDYADQSHFNRHFKRFIGVTPTQFVRDGDRHFVRRVMAARHAIASRHPLGLSSAAG